MGYIIPIKIRYVTHNYCLLKKRWMVLSIKLFIGIGLIPTKIKLNVKIKFEITDKV